MRLSQICKEESKISAVVEDATMVITISDKANRNALDEPLYEALARKIEFASQDPSINSIVIKGDSGIFSVGNTLEGLQETKEKNRLGQCTRRFLHTLVENKKPMLALVDGPAIGIGATLLFHCDIVIATKRSFFQTPFVDLNVAPEAASSLLGPRQLGYRNAFAFLVLGEKWRAKTALEKGLIDTMVETYDEAEIEISKYSKKLSQKPLNSLIAARSLVRLPIDEMKTAVCREIIEFERCISSRQ